MQATPGLRADPAVESAGRRSAGSSQASRAWGGRFVTPVPVAAYSIHDIHESTLAGAYLIEMDPRGPTNAASSRDRIVPSEFAARGLAGRRCRSAASRSTRAGRPCAACTFKSRRTRKTSWCDAPRERSSTSSSICAPRFADAPALVRSGIDRRQSPLAVRSDGICAWIHHAADDTEVLLHDLGGACARFAARRPLERSGVRHRVADRARGHLGARRSLSAARRVGRRDAREARAGDRCGRLHRPLERRPLCAAGLRGARRAVGEGRRARGSRLPEAQRASRRSARRRRDRCPDRASAADPSAALRLDRHARAVLEQRGELSLARREPPFAAVLRRRRRRRAVDGRELRGIRLVAGGGVQRTLEPAREQLRHPCTPYAECKIALQQTLADVGRTQGLSTAWGRIFFQFGPHEHPERLVASVIISLLSGREAPCTHGRQIRSFLHVADVGAAFAALLDSELEGAVNIGSGEPDLDCRPARAPRPTDRPSGSSRGSAPAQRPRASRRCSFPISAGCATRWASGRDGRSMRGSPMRSAGGAANSPAARAAMRPS